MIANHNLATCTTGISSASAPLPPCRGTHGHHGSGQDPAEEVCDASETTRTPSRQVTKLLELRQRRLPRLFVLWALRDTGAGRGATGFAGSGLRFPPSFGIALGDVLEPMTVRTRTAYDPNQFESTFPCREPPDRPLSGSVRLSEAPLTDGTGCVSTTLQPQLCVAFNPLPVGRTDHPQTVDKRVCQSILSTVHPGPHARAMRPGAPGTPTTMTPSLLCGLGLTMLAATVAGGCAIHGRDRGEKSRFFSTDIGPVRRVGGANWASFSGM